MSDPTDTGLLTQDQREFLQNPNPEMTDRGIRAARERIRNRLQVAFDDLRLLLNPEKTEQEINLQKVLAGVDSERVWPLSALLFMWAIEHPTFLDWEDMTDVLGNPDKDVDLGVQMDRTAASFNGQAERGVRTALGFSDLHQVPEVVENDLISKSIPI